MKNYLLLFTFIFGVFGSATAQQKLARKEKLNAVPFTKVNLTGLEESPETSTIPEVTAHPYLKEGSLEFRDEVEVLIGTTIYDLQTNNTMQSRLQAAPDGSLAATWIQGYVPTNYPDRGTGYAKFLNGAWTEVPTERLEAETRTGWPSVSRVADGSEVIINHGGGGGFNVLRNPNRAILESKIPTEAGNAGLGMLWPRSATGGADGNTIHVIGITTPIANGGELYEGVDGHILYFRSTDAGETWDKTDVKLPEINSDFYGAMGADSYYITAKGDLVAVALFSTFGDSKVVISEDNGETWKSTNFIDFPVDRYMTDQGYSLEDIGGVDPRGPGVQEGAGIADSLALFTTDNTGTILIDNDNDVHVFFGEMFVSDADTTDGNTSFYPGWSGVRYWNPVFGADSTVVIADVSDLNGNDTLDVTGGNDVYAGYFTSQTSFASGGVDTENRLYLAYSGIAETNFNEEDGQYYRHIFLIASEDGGETWTEPVDLITEEFSQEPDLVEFVEGVFPAVADDVTDMIHLTYQQDFRPGLNSRGDSDPAETNFIIYLPLPLSTVGFATSVEEVVAPTAFAVEMFPNPATDEVLIQYELQENATVSIDFTNTVGQLVKTVQVGQSYRGQQQLNVNVADLTTGIYTVKIKIDNKITTQKLVVK